MMMDLLHLVDNIPKIADAKESGRDLLVDSFARNVECQGISNTTEVRLDSVDSLVKEEFR
jgi:hypothetical protein